MFVAVTGGLTLDEPGTDLGLALAVASSYRSRPVLEGTLAVGEVSLSGELRRVSRVEARVREAAALGFRRAAVPAMQAADARTEGIEVVPVATVREAIGEAAGREGRGSRAPGPRAAPRRRSGAGRDAPRRSCCARGGASGSARASRRRWRRSPAGRSFLWGLEALERCAAVDGIVVVGPVRRLQDVLAATGFAPGKVVAWTEGGRARQDSVARGLRALPPGFDLVAVHDSARALVTPALVARVVADAVTHGAAIAAVPLEDTLKRASLGRIEDTVPRAALWRAQTPQVFRREWLEAAHGAPPPRPAGRAPRSPTTRCWWRRWATRCSSPRAIRSNFKITTAQDLALAGAWLARREG